MKASKLQNKLRFSVVSFLYVVGISLFFTFSVETGLILFCIIFVYKNLTCRQKEINNRLMMNTELIAKIHQNDVEFNLDDYLEEFDLDDYDTDN